MKVASKPRYVLCNLVAPTFPITIRVPSRETFKDTTSLKLMAPWNYKFVVNIEHRSSTRVRFRDTTGCSLEGSR